ncbi:tail fiber protein [Roseibacterium beibuensis]|uniref:phage tail protein n=1 Tax=[Roseibacterium] beibuensis TaxID=1193142 RepID=UPI00217F0858|nr:tail fiber protein [Roseibacterium beibuensis]MCS6627503.1 tail fiber protein [Roseibacterium beibuensis]
MKHLKLMALAAASGLAAVGVSTSATAQVEPILGQVTLFATNWCPVGWAQANGAVLPIQQNSALFSLYGTNYGGNGSTTFALPNLMGRAPVSWSSTSPIGSAFGASSVTLTTAQMPTHTHMVMGSSAMTSTNNPAGASLGTFPAGQTIYAANTSTPDVPMHAGIIGPAGGNLPVPTQSPVLSMNWCVAMQGIYPSHP